MASLTNFTGIDHSFTIGSITVPYRSLPALPTLPIMFLRRALSKKYPGMAGLLMFANTIVLIGRLTPSASVVLLIIKRKALLLYVLSIASLIF